MPRARKVSKRQLWVRMTRIRLIAGTGCRKARMVATSLQAIENNWGVKEGRIRVQVLGKVGSLPADLRRVVDAAGPDRHIEGSALVDLYTQRSGERESGCDAPSEGAELPLAMETSSFPSKSPTAKVRHNSCHYSVENDVRTIRREFVRTNKRVNFVPPSIPQQTPPAVRVRLMQLVGRIGRREISKGKKITENSSKVPQLSQAKIMTSLSSREEKVEERNSLASRKISKDINNSK